MPTPQLFIPRHKRLALAVVRARATVMGRPAGHAWEQGAATSAKTLATPTASSSTRPGKQAWPSEMIGLDTNVVVHDIVQDDPKQSSRATRLIEGLIP